MTEQGTPTQSSFRSDAEGAPAQMPRGRARVRFPRPPAAFVVATSVLVVGLAGTATAAPDAVTSVLGKSKVKTIAKRQATGQIKRLVPAIADQEITKRAAGLSVASAETATRADSAQTATRASSAETATRANTATTATRANTATNATQAQNAGTANGVRPVKVSLAANPGDPETTFVDEGGVMITGRCTAGPEARLRAIGTANNGMLMLDAINADGSNVEGNGATFHATVARSIATAAAPNDVKRVTVTYRGAAGAVVSGELVIAAGAGASACVIAGTLFVS